MNKINQITFEKKNNFYLYLSQVTYKFINLDGKSGKSDRRRSRPPTTLNLSQLAKIRSPDIQIPVGFSRFSCTSMDISGPITFLTSKAKLVLDPWRNVEITSFQFKMKTFDKVRITS